MSSLLTKGTPALDQVLPARARARLLRWAPFLLLLGLLVLCGYLAARLSWQFAASPAAGASAPGETTPRGTGDTGGETLGDKIVAAHLFGTAEEPAAAAAKNAPETSLDLDLTGVAAGNRKGLSYAIITSNGKHADTYAVGAKLPDGALIRKILPDRIILAHNGRLETLRLPNAATAIRAEQAGPKSNSAARLEPRAKSGHVPISPVNAGWEIERNPKGLAQYLRFRPYSSAGHIQGYRVYPGQDKELFQKAGLQPGDVITSVNGISLDKPAGIKEAFAQMRSLKGPLRVTILRNNHKLHLTIHFGG